MIARLLAASLAVASAAVLIYFVWIVLTPNPYAPPEPRTWPTAVHTDVPTPSPPVAASPGG